MSDSKLTAQPRTEFGKGAARRLRRASLIPAVVYGHGGEPRHIALPGHETMLALKQTNALLEISVEGEDDILALAKDVQRDPVRRVIEHVDLVIVKRGEKVHVEVPVHVVGQAGPDTLVQIELMTLRLEAEATSLPDAVEVDVQGAEAGTQFLAGGITLPAGSSLVDEPDQLVVHVTAQVLAAADDEGEGEAAEATEEAAAE